MLITFKGYEKHLYMTFGERILSLRKKLKWSQDERAKRIGTSAPITFNGLVRHNDVRGGSNMADIQVNLLP